MQCRALGQRQTRLLSTKRKAVPTVRCSSTPSPQYNMNPPSSRLVSTVQSAHRWNRGLNSQRTSKVTTTPYQRLSPSSRCSLCCWMCWQATPRSSSQGRVISKAPLGPSPYVVNTTGAPPLAAAHNIPAAVHEETVQVLAQRSQPHEKEHARALVVF